MVKKHKSWQEKMVDIKDLPKLIKVTLKMVGRWRAKLGDTVVIQAPIDMDEIKC